MRDNEKYKAMVVSFRMSELQTLMVYAGKSKAGKKSDLQVGQMIQTWHSIYENNSSHQSKNG